MEPWPCRAPGGMECVEDRDCICEQSTIIIDDNVHVYTYCRSLRQSDIFLTSCPEHDRTRATTAAGGDSWRRPVSPVGEHITSCTGNTSYSPLHVKVVIVVMNQ